MPDAKMPTPSHRWQLALVALVLLALAPFLVQGAAGTALKGILAVAAAGTMAFVGVREVRRRRGARTQASVVLRSVLTPRSGVAVVEFEGRRLLVGYGDGFATVLASSSAKGRCKGKGARS